MKLKNIILIAAAVMIAVPSFAQEKNEKTQRDTRWFIGAGGGMNFGFEGESFVDRTNSHIGAGTSVEAYFGKFFNNWLGFRAGYQGLSISEQYRKYGKDPFHYGHADLLFRVTDWFIPYVHGGYAHLHKGSAAGGVGVMMPIKVSPRISIVPDLKATLLSGDAFTDGAKKCAASLGGSLGLRVMLGKVKEKSAGDNGDADRIAAEEAARRAAEEAAKKAEQEKQDSIARAKAEEEARKAEQERLDSIARAEAERQAHEAALRELAKAMDVQTLFDFDSFELTDTAKGQLDKVAEYLKLNDAVSVEVGGHTDSMGTEDYNQTLSEQRAKSVVDYLSGKGIDASRLSAVGYGKKHPVATNDTEEGRAQNRRIEFKVK